MMKAMDSFEKVDQKQHPQQPQQQQQQIKTKRIDKLDKKFRHIRQNLRNNNNKKTNESSSINSSSRSRSRGGGGGGGSNGNVNDGTTSTATGPIMKKSEYNDDTTKTTTTTSLYEPLVSSRQVTTTATTTTTQTASLTSESIFHKKKKQQEQQLRPMSPITLEKHGFDPNECITRFQEQARTSILSAYNMDNMIRHTSKDGVLTTSLTEDILSLLHTLVKVLDTCFIINPNKDNTGMMIMNSQVTSLLYPNKNQSTVLNPKDGIQYFTDGILFLFRTIKYTQQTFKSSLLLTESNTSTDRQQKQQQDQQNTSVVGMEDLCAAANDCFRMSEKLEDFLSSNVLKKYPFLYQHQPTTTNDNIHNNTPTPSSTNSSTKSNGYSSSPGECDAKRTKQNSISDEDDDDDESHNNNTSSSIVLQIGTELCTVFLHDAVHIAERCQCIIMEHVYYQTSLPIDCFSTQWEIEWTTNEVTISLLNVFDSYLVDIQTFLRTEFLYHKVVVSCVKAIVGFYVHCFIKKANAIDHDQRLLCDKHFGYHPCDNKHFRSIERALLRMKDDYYILNQYFCNKFQTSTTTTNPENIIIINNNNNNNNSISSNNNNIRQQNNNNKKSKHSRIITNELSILEIIRECLQTMSFHSSHSSTTKSSKRTLVADSTSSTTQHAQETRSDDCTTHNTSTHNDSDLIASLESFIVVLHKRTGCNTMVTKYLMSDLWLLSQYDKTTKAGQRTILNTFNHIKNDLELVGTNMKEQKQQQQSTLPIRSPSNNNKLKKKLLFHNNKNSDNDTNSIVSFVRLDMMLNKLYEDRIAQGSIPLGWCLNNNIVIDASDPSDDNSHDIDIILAKHISNLTKNITKFPGQIMKELQRPKKHHHGQQKEGDVVVSTKGSF